MIRQEKINELKGYIEELKLIKQEKLDKIPSFLGVTSYNCTLNNGETVVREQLLKGGKVGSAVIILPVIKGKENEVILAVESRVFTNESVLVNLPAGYIENGEDVIEAAKRELLEETGYTFDDKNTIFLGEYYQDQGCSSALNKYLLVFDCIKVADQKLDDGEFIKYFVCRYDEVLDLMNLGFIKDANSFIALTSAKQYIRR